MWGESPVSVTLVLSVIDDYPRKMLFSLISG